VSVSSQIFGNRNSGVGRHPSLVEVLRSTTLEEFLEAVEKVAADDKRKADEVSVLKTYFPRH
jgi:hypothetical protein